MAKIDLDQIIERSKELKDFKKFNKESSRLYNLLSKLYESEDKENVQILSEWFLIRLVTIWEISF